MSIVAQIKELNMSIRRLISRKLTTARIVACILFRTSAAVVLLNAPYADVESSRWRMLMFCQRQTLLWFSANIIIYANLWTKSVIVLSVDYPLDVFGAVSLSLNCHCFDPSVVGSSLYG